MCTQEKYAHQIVQTSVNSLSGRDFTFKIKMSRLAICHIATLVDIILKHIPANQQTTLNNQVDDNDGIINHFARDGGQCNRFNDGGQRSRFNCQNKWSTSDKTTSSRTKLCGICGGPGHDGLTDGCDLMCKTVNIKKFLTSNKRSTPEKIQELMAKFKERTDQKIRRFKQNNRISQLELNTDTEARVLNALNNTSPSLDSNYNSDDNDSDSDNSDSISE